jgi:glycosyltransferase involved in cell wall biosynthesis
MSKKILVVMPLYNSEKTVGAAIESVLSQTHKNLMLTIVDDCSTDNSLEIAKKFESDPRVSIYKLSKNMGAYHARNAGLFFNKDAHWDYFTTHDADDVSLKHRYASVMSLFNKTKVVAVQDTFERVSLFTKESLGQSLSMAHATFRRVAFEKVGYFDSSTRFGADWEHWQRVKLFASNNGYTTAGVAEKVGISYVHENNLTVRIPINSEPRLKYVEAATKNLKEISSSGNIFNNYKINKGSYRIVKKSPSSAARNRYGLKLAVVVLTWQRIGNLQATLTQLANQTHKDFDTYVSNANINKQGKVDLICSGFSARMSVKVSHDGNSLYSFRRLVIADRLYREGYEAVIFLDDDVSVGKFFIEDCINYFEPKTYQSWYAWKFGVSGEYYDRERVTDINEKVDYGGAGVSMLDLQIFKSKRILNAPKHAHKIEDLWMSYVVDTSRGWSVKYLPVKDVSLAGADSVALHKVVQGSDFTKTDFLKYLISSGWKIE